MRFEVAAGFFVGLLLPVLETARRGLGHWAVAGRVGNDSGASVGLDVPAAGVGLFYGSDEH
jgi:hypothetical protein